MGYFVVEYNAYNSSLVGVVNEVGPPAVEVSAKISTFLLPYYQTSIITYFLIYTNYYTVSDSPIHRPKISFLPLRSIPNKDHGVMVVIVTHDLELAKKMNRIIKLRDGLIVEDVKLR